MDRAAKLTKGSKRSKFALLAVATLAACSLPLGGLAPNTAQVFTQAGKSENGPTPPLGCFNTIGCNFIYNTGINQIVVQVHCTPNLSTSAVYGTDSAGGYTDSGMLCGSFAVTLTNGQTLTLYCGFDCLGAPCTSA